MDQRIKTKLETQARHASMRCRVFEVKVEKALLSKTRLEHLQRLFLEAKWFYNHCVQNIPTLETLDTKRKMVPVKTPNGVEDRPMFALSSQMRQGMTQRLWTSLKALSTLKKKGERVGWIQFKSHVDCIPLKQLGFTYDIVGKKKIRLQNLKGKLRVNGLDQIKERVEVANANLVRRHQDYYFRITTYEPKESNPVPQEAIGIDLGCETQLTLSNGIKIQFAVPPTRRLKRLDRKIHKHKREDSKNRRKDQLKRQKEYHRIQDRRRDVQRKIATLLVKNFKTITIQDDSLKGWQASGHGRKISWTGLGGITEALHRKASTLSEVNRFFPSTKTCSKCGNIREKLEQWERVFECPHCDLRMDRDVNAAINILEQGKKEVAGKIPAGRGDFKPQERSAPSEGLLESLNAIPRVSAKLASLSGEAAPL